MLEWREREHELHDNTTMDDSTTISTLKNCFLYKLWVIQSTKAQVELMTWLVNSWDVREIHHWGP